PAVEHEKTFSTIVAVVLLLLFAASLPASLRRSDDDGVVHGDPPRWPLWLAIGLLALAAVLAAFVSDWFVDALEPAMATLGISEVFAGLVVFSIAGQPIQNSV